MGLESDRLFAEYIRNNASNKDAVDAIKALQAQLNILERSGVVKEPLNEASKQRKQRNLPIFEAGIQHTARVGEVFKRVREQRGDSTRVAAEKVGTVAGNISRIERLITSPTERLIANMSEGYGVPIGVLFGEEIDDKIATENVNPTENHNPDEPQYRDMYQSS